MKVLIVGDPHGSKKIYKLPFRKADITLITGDIGKADLARKYFFKYGSRWRAKLAKQEIEKANLQPIKSSLEILTFLNKRIKTYFIFGNVEKSDSQIRRMNKEFGIKLPLFESKVKKLRNVQIISKKKINFNGMKCLVDFTLRELCSVTLSFKSSE